jgi:hypothetical protein
MSGHSSRFESLHPTLADARATFSHKWEKEGRASLLPWNGRREPREAGSDEGVAETFSSVGASNA